jgi:hypothetical protein
MGRAPAIAQQQQPEIDAAEPSTPDKKTLKPGMKDYTLDAAAAGPSQLQRMWNGA